MSEFIFSGCSTNDRENDPGRKEFFKTNAVQYAQIARRIANDYKLEFVSLQEKLNEAAEVLGVEQTTFDGVHPTAIGHEVIAREWIKHFEMIK